MKKIAFDPTSPDAVAARDAYMEATKRALPPYVYRDDLVLAIKVALATDRPLLLRGAPGSGKSTLAEDIAARTGRRYYERVVSSRTTANDLLWSFDTVRRLGDAQAQAAGAAVDINLLHRYVTPGVLWWAFDEASAARRGLPEDTPGKRALDLAFHAVNPAENQGRAGAGAVVLLDEIDKAEPDMPNDLLVPIGSKTFTVTEIDTRVTAKSDVLVVITTNGERELPPAFLRRCIVLTLDPPSRTLLEDIVRAHFPEAAFPALDAPWLSKILTHFDDLVDAAETAAVRAPGTAELLDAVNAFVSLPEAKAKWNAVALATLWKNADPPKLAAPQGPAS